MGAAVSKRKNLRNDAISSVAAKVRAARAFGDYLSQNHPENCNGSAHLLSDTYIGQDTDSPDISGLQNNNLLHPYHHHHHQQHQHCATPPGPGSGPAACSTTSSSSSLSSSAKRRLSVERSLSAESDSMPSSQLGGGSSSGGSRRNSGGGGGGGGGLAAAVMAVTEGSLKPPARVYTITREGGTLMGGRSSQESLELEVLKPAPGEPAQPQQHTQQQQASHSRGQSQQSLQGGTSSSSSSSSSSTRSHHRGGGGPLQRSSTTGAGAGAGAQLHSQQHLQPQGHQGQGHHHHQPLRSSGSAHNIRDWGGRRGGSREDCSPDCMAATACVRPPCRAQRSLDLDTSPHDGTNNWFPKENVFSFQTASTTMQASGGGRGLTLFQNLKKLMRPYSIEFKSPLELSAQGKEMIELYFDFRLFRLWKTRQHSKLLDYDDLL
ncbi:NMDA receptor synaptonuclear signaling and neuronal migration factor-like [Engraulis encrasicolus]|uniref:NMDA receptor synaptonuclear signaling and neuronal migration factor-like n=1 Tax=Engraulis encrasicolus TaxID=184585 RepID=UPI002FCF7550